MLQRHLKMNARLFRRGDNGIPLLRHRQIQLAQRQGRAVWRPIQILAIPMIHPDARPVFMRCAHLPKNIRHVVGDWAVRDVPGHILAPGKKAPSIAGNEAPRIGRVNANETRAGRRTGHDPRSGLQMADGERRTVQCDATDTVSPGHRRHVSHTPCCAAIKKRGQ